MHVGFRYSESGTQRREDNSAPVGIAVLKMGRWRTVISRWIGGG